MRRLFLKSFLMSVLVLAGANVSAHGLATTESGLVGNYLVELEYDNLDVINSGEATSFNFELLDAETKKAVEFDRVYVQVSKKVGDYPVVFVSNLTPVNRLGEKSAGATLFLPVEGAYYFKLVYYSNNEQLVEKTFELQVGPANQGNKGDYDSKYFWVAFLAGGLIFGFLLGKKI